MGSKSSSGSNGAASRVALLGFGTVGRSVARILCSGEVPQLYLTRIFNRRIDRKRVDVDWVPASVQWTESIDEALAPDVDLVIEVVGGLRPPRNGCAGRSSPASPS